MLTEVNPAVKEMLKKKLTLNPESKLGKKKHELYRKRDFDILLQMISSQYKKNSPSSAFVFLYITLEISTTHSVLPSLLKQNMNNQVILERLVYYHY